MVDTSDRLMDRCPSIWREKVASVDDVKGTLKGNKNQHQKKNNFCFVYGDEKKKRT